MCGIGGFYGFRDDNLIKKFSRELEHRGPDGEGYYIDDNVTLLNRRLAIIDIGGGDQPIYNETKDVVVVYNGEIYNYKDLRKSLEKAGHKFSTQSDTEVIIHGYEEWKESCFDRLNGMFAIGLYDIKNKKLILVRDHFGIKPLYYSFLARHSNPKSTASVDDGLVFSSEIKPIFYSGLVKSQPNDKVIYRYLKYRVHDDNEETFFTGIKKLLPGQMIIVQKSPTPRLIRRGYGVRQNRRTKFKIQNYSNLETDLLKNSQKKDVTPETISQFKKQLEKAIKYRLISDVPVGTCLSGGLDSSTVVAVVNKLLEEKTAEARSVGKKQNTFSAVFPKSANDEEFYIDSLLKQLKSVESHKINPLAEEFFSGIGEFIKIQEEPTISTGPYAQYKVMEMARGTVKVLLDGQGSDEMMAGYLPYYFVYLNQLVKENKFFDLLRETVGSADVLIKHFFGRFKTVVGLKKNIAINSLLNPEFTAKFRNENFQPVNDSLKGRLVEDIFSNSLQSLLRYEDKNAMAFSIEGRVPFLDFNLIKYIFSLSDEAIIKNGWNKYILRQSVKGLLPDVITNRRNKIGFTTPEHEWFMRMKNRIYTYFMSESFISRKYFNHKEVMKAFQLFIEGRFDDTMIFWRLLNLELWLREFFDTKPALKESSQYVFSKANPGKEISMKINGKTYLRYPVKTSVVKKADKLDEIIKSSLDQPIKILKNKQKWFLAVSEKIVAISQGRSYFIWDIRPGFFADLLSRFVTRTPFGIGLGSPWTMQLAINEIGLPKILLATVVSAVSKPFGQKGLFYTIAGDQVRSIDGPTEYSLYPSNVSAKLGPKNPTEVAKRIHQSVTTNFQLPISNFQGVVILDANDLGQNVLGNSTDIDNRLIENIFKDNPMGQANEQTPIVLVFTD